MKGQKCKLEKALFSYTAKKNGCRITVNANSYTIITAHKEKR
ncbi:MAG: DUF3781 domain-containing protein [Lachnospiraceae bacterium]|nr:DUF3781 domain-containing protein [Lachnospiraceae bacterium]